MEIIQWIICTKKTVENETNENVLKMSENVIKSAFKYKKKLKKQLKNKS